MTEVFYSHYTFIIFHSLQLLFIPRNDSPRLQSWSVTAQELTGLGTNQQLIATVIMYGDDMLEAKVRQLGSHRTATAHCWAQVLGYSSHLTSNGQSLRITQDTSPHISTAYP